MNDIPQEIGRKLDTKYFDLGQFGRLCFHSLSPEHAKFNIIEHMLYNVLPKMGVTEDDVKKYLIVSKLKNIIPNLKPEHVDYQSLLTMVQNIKAIETKNEEEMFRQKRHEEHIKHIRKTLNLNNIEVDDDTVLEVYSYITKL